MAEPRDNEWSRTLFQEEEGTAKLWGKGLDTGRGEELVFAMVMHECERWTIKKAECRIINVA